MRLSPESPYPGDRVDVLINMLDRFGNVLSGFAVSPYLVSVAVLQEGNEMAVGVATFAKNGDLTPLRFSVDVNEGVLQFRAHATLEVSSLLLDDDRIVQEFHPMPLNATATLRVYPYCRVFYRLEATASGYTCIPCESGAQRCAPCTVCRVLCE